MWWLCVLWAICGVTGAILLFRYEDEDDDGPQNVTLLDLFILIGISFFGMFLLAFTFILYLSTKGRNIIVWRRRID